MSRVIHIVTRFIIPLRERVISISARRRVLCELYGIFNYHLLARVHGLQVPILVAYYRPFRIFYFIFYEHIVAGTRALIFYCYNIIHRTSRGNRISAFPFFYDFKTRVNLAISQKPRRWLVIKIKPQFINIV